MTSIPPSSETQEAKKGLSKIHTTNTQYSLLVTVLFGGKKQRFGFLTF